MKQQLWIVNSALLAISFITIIVSLFLRQSPPPLRVKRIAAKEPTVQKPLSPEEIKNIYKYDLFGTFSPKKFAPSLQKLVTPMPEPKKPPIAKPPKLIKPDFIPSLKVGLKGIAFASDEEKSICIIADETKKEQVYHVGEKIKDGQIIKIAQNRVTILRVNGQHETIFLREDEIRKRVKPKKWDHVVQKVETNKFEIDIAQFPQEIASLGTLVEMLGLLIAYQNGNPTGMKVTHLNKNSLGEALGLQKNDVIFSINGINCADKKNRIIPLVLKRDNQDINLSYQLVKGKRIIRKEFAPVTGKEDKKDEKLFKLSKLQEREKRRREFAKKHPNKQQQQRSTIDEIRRRLLENIKSRVRNTRIR
jgi:type II secretion system protein C